LEGETYPSNVRLVSARLLMKVHPCRFCNVTPAEVRRAVVAGNHTSVDALQSRNQSGIRIKPLMNSITTKDGTQIYSKTE